MNYQKNLFLINFLSGATFIILQGPNISVSEFNFQYGRELKVSNWFSIEGYAGIGNFTLTSSSYYYPKNISVASFPIRIKLICYTGKHFALVSNSNYTMNSYINNFSSNLTFEYHF